MGNGTALAIPLKRSKTVLRPDPSRVLLRQFDPGNAQRMSGIVKRIMALPEAQVGTLLKQVSADFAQRHRNLPQRFLDRFEDLEELLPEGAAITPATAAADRLLLFVGILIGIGCAVQSIDGAPPGPDKFATRRRALHS